MKRFLTIFLGLLLLISFSITVAGKIINVAGVMLNKTSLVLTVGEHATLTANVFPTKATNPSVKWLTGNKDVATINETGVVSAVGPGATTITVKTIDGSFEAICVVEVDLVSSVETGEVTDVTPFSARLSGKANLAASISEDMNIGVVYSKNADFIPHKDAAAPGFDAEYRFFVDVDQLQPGTKYYFRSYLYQNGLMTYGSTKQFDTPTSTLKTPVGDVTSATDYTTDLNDQINVNDWVDLGLSVKWRKYNLGATKPEEFGDYYAWGEVETKSMGCYVWNTYKWCKGSNDKLTKYNNNPQYGRCDNKTKLDLADDVAHVKLGGKWRMPTIEEFEELIANTNPLWTTINGVSGVKFTSTKPGYTDKWIFLPDAQFYDSCGVYGDFNYWSSSIDIDCADCAQSLHFCYGDNRVIWTARSNGLSIRPVLD